ncbi:MAG: alpha/beta fold hydrolase [Flavobacteriales bacterium]|jgi:pimeloyl-ACP methyl ester carboxylesterase|tara:strand:+ start:7966 stop:8667 length:702 start_codon:yes stop_codon:yes gene_type:complete
MKDKLIMIPGTLCDYNLFKYQTEGLKDLVDCRVASNTSASSLKQVAKNILDNYSGSFSVMGLSYGGIVAFELLRQAPERINKLILMNTNYKQPSERTRINQQRFIGMAYLGEFKEITSKILIDAMLHPKNAKKQELRETILNMALNVGTYGFFNQVKAQLARPDSSKDLQNIKCPTLIITGKEDNICPLKLHKEMAETIPNSTLKIIEECGHLSALEQPNLVNSIIIDWWNKN